MRLGMKRSVKSYLLDYDFEIERLRSILRCMLAKDVSSKRFSLLVQTVPSYSYCNNLLFSLFCVVPSHQC